MHNEAHSVCLHELILKNLWLTLIAGLALTVSGGAVEYVESTGTQHFDTGIVPNSSTRVVMDFQYTLAPGSGMAVSGWQSSGSKEVFTFGINGGKFQTGVSGNNAWQDSKVTGDERRRIFDVSSGSQKLGTVSGGMTNLTQFGTATMADTAEAGQTICLFARHGEWITPAQIGNYIKMRVYGCKIYSGETVVRDYVPYCENGVYGLYDRQNGTFSEAASQDGLIGPADRLLDYVESTGGEYLDTGYVPNSKTRVVADIQYPENPTGMAWNGWQASGSKEVFYFGINGGKFGIAINNVESGAAHLSNVSADAKRRVFDIASGSQKLGLVGHGTTNLTEFAQAAFATNNLPTDRTLYLFARHTQWNKVSNFFRMRVFGLRIYEGDTIVHDFVPCARGGQTGLKDLVSNEFRAAVGGNLRTVGMPIAECDYVEATGQQYVDTGVQPGPTTRVVVDMKVNSVSQNMLMGWVCSGGSKTMLWGARADSKRFAYYMGDTYVSLSNMVVNGSLRSYDFERHVWDLAPGSQKLDNDVFDTASVAGSTTYGQTLYLFARHGEWLSNCIGYSDNRCDARIYSCKIYSGTTLVRDFVPCLAEGIPGLYDRVKQAFYPSQTTVPLKAAPMPTREKLFYVEANGNQYINTGVVAKPSTRIVTEMRFLAKATGGAHQMMGWAASNPEEAVLWGLNGNTATFGGYFNMGYSSPAGYVLAQDMDRHTFDFQNASQKIDGVEYGTTTIESPLIPDTMYLFGRHKQWNTTIDWLCKARIYSCRIYEGGRLIRNLVPAKVGGKACLYDKVDGMPYFSESGTDLIPGERSDRGSWIVLY